MNYATLMVWISISADLVERVRSTARSSTLMRAGNRKCFRNAGLWTGVLNQSWVCIYECQFHQFIAPRCLFPLHFSSSHHSLNTQNRDSPSRHYKTKHAIMPRNFFTNRGNQRLSIYVRVKLRPGKRLQCPRRRSRNLDCDVLAGGVVIC